MSKKRISIIFYLNFSFSDKIEKTEEPGFTGPTTNWFNDDEFNKKLVVSKDSQEKDYYFNSYSTFYIHEEMIKDRVK
jgi:hypothetical protein